jgi:hypothetical protein
MELDRKAAEIKKCCGEGAYCPHYHVCPF